MSLTQLLLPGTVQERCASKYGVFHEMMIMMYLFKFPVTRPFLPQKDPNKCFFQHPLHLQLLMEEIPNNHQGCIKLCKYWDFTYQPQLVISGFQPSTEGTSKALDWKPKDASRTLEVTAYVGPLALPVMKIWQNTWRIAVARSQPQTINNIAET